MALSASGLSSAIVAQLNSQSPTGTEQGGTTGAAERKKFADAIATAVVDYLKANTVVTGTCPAGTAGGPLADGKVT